MRSMKEPTVLAPRTILRAAREEPNISSPSFWRERLTSVSVTWRAFFDVASENTITAPAATRNMSGVLAEPLSESIMKDVGSVAPEAVKSQYDE